MTLTGVFVRFAPIYLGLLIAAGFVLSMLDVGRVPGVGVAMLLGSVMWVCTAFAKRNGRYFDEAEKKKVKLGLTLIAVAVDLLLVPVALASRDIAIDAKLLAFTLAFSALINACVVIWFVNATEKNLLKRRILPASV